ncbi:MAG: hypothetical protein ACK5AO_10140 [bacterium]
MKSIISILFVLMVQSAVAQIPTPDTTTKKTDTSTINVDTTVLGTEIKADPDSILRIINLNPFFTLQVDSTLVYDFQINKPTQGYFWYLKNAPIGVKIERNTGLLSFKADRSYFKSGKLKYDTPYNIEMGVQNLKDANERFESNFTLLFYNTEVIVTKLTPTVGNMMMVQEGDSIHFRVQCEEGTFPVEQITINTNEPISNFKTVKNCNDEFIWKIPYDFIRDNDTARQKLLMLQFIGSDKFQNKDTATVRLYIKPGVNYPEKIQEHQIVENEIKKYVNNLKLTFFVVSSNINQTKKTRTGFDISGSSTAMLGTILSTAGGSESAKNIGKVLPSIGLTLVPVKEAVAPQKVQEQNTASQIRSTIKRFEYMLSDNTLIGERDPDILVKTKKLRDELKQSQMQLVDLPMLEMDPRYSQEEAEKYFNNPKVSKKYKLKVN